MIDPYRIVEIVGEIGSMKQAVVTIQTLQYLLELIRLTQQKIYHQLAIMRIENTLIASQ